MTTISDKDLDALEQIVDVLADLDEALGGEGNYDTRTVTRATHRTATVVYRWDAEHDPDTLAAAAMTMSGCHDKLGHLARKVLADHGRRHRLDQEPAQ